MLQFAENKTLEMFEKDYPRLRKDAVAPFTKLFFAHLRSYLTDDLIVSANGQIHQQSAFAMKNAEPRLDLHAVVHDFFKDLFPQVHHDMLSKNRQTASPVTSVTSNDYISCLRDSVQDIRPFDEIPNLLITQLEQSFDSSRALLRSLLLAIEVINSTSNSGGMSDACVRSLVRSSYCSYCAGHVTARPCFGYCLNVMRGCLSQLAELEKPWNEFISSLERLSSALIGNHNAENVLATVDERLREALRYAGDSAGEINKRVSISTSLFLFFLWL